jgi:hypothetical protein
METTLINNPKLLQHLERLSKVENSLDYSSYVFLVNQQNETQPSFKKWEPALQPLPDPLTDQNRINVLNSNFRYVGIKKSQSTDRNYYEFVDTSNREESYYKDFKFLYFEVNSENESYLISKLPYQYQWNTSTLQITKEVPKKIYLIERTADSFNSFYSFLVSDSTHPFLPSLYFSGRVVVLNNGVLLYEYFDNEGLWGIKDALYMSPLKPNIDFPLGELKSGMLEKQDCWLSSVGQFPSIGSLKSLGRFTGYSTTDLYNSKQKFYLYKRKDQSTFLSKNPPHPEAEALAEHILLMEKNEPILIINPELGSSFLGIQTSSQEPLTFICVE